MFCGAGLPATSQRQYGASVRGCSWGLLVRKEFSCALRVPGNTRQIGVSCLLVLVLLETMLPSALSRAKLAFPDPFARGPANVASLAIDYSCWSEL